MLLLKVIYIKGGPRTDPCGMPKYKAATPGWKSFKDTYWLH